VQARNGIDDDPRQSNLILTKAGPNPFTMGTIWRWSCLIVWRAFFAPQPGRADLPRGSSNPAGLFLWAPGASPAALSRPRGYQAGFLARPRRGLYPVRSLFVPMTHPLVDFEGEHPALVMVGLPGVQSPCALRSAPKAPRSETESCRGAFLWAAR
jgi:hypothetical protein